MNAREFYDLVVRVRQAQKDYETYKVSTKLKHAKQLERELDNEIKRVNAIIAQQEDTQTELDF